MVGQLTIRAAERADASRIAEIYNEGIDGREATFQTSPRRVADVEAWFEERGPLLVAESDDVVIGWARVSAYADSCVYGGVGEYTIYLDPAAQGHGAGRRLLDALAEEAEREGYYKLVGKLFTTNRPSIAVAERCGFRQVGVHRRHGRLDGEWKDVVVVERLLGEAAG